MLKGDLDFEKFIVYIQQDALYLTDLCGSLQHISHRLLQDPKTTQHGMKFASYAQQIHKTEQKMHSKYLDRKNTHSFFQFSGRVQHKIPVIQEYTHHLLHTTQFAPIEAAIASVIPCYWTYKELGIHMDISGCALNHPYKNWIKTYSSPLFVSSTEEIIQILELYVQSNPHANQKEIIETFVKSAQFERAFLDSVDADTLQSRLNAQETGVTLKAA